MDKQLAKLLSRLTSLKNNIPQKGWGVPEKYIKEFNSVVEELEKISGDNLKEFIVPDNELSPKMTSIDMTGHKKYTSENYCDKEFILMKIDGILGYFTLLLQPVEMENKLGFDVENNN